MIKSITVAGGMSVKRLKETIKDWPETTLEDGEMVPSEVWVGVGDGLSTQASSLMPLNKRGGMSDMLIECKLEDIFDVARKLMAREFRFNMHDESKYQVTVAKLANYLMANEVGDRPGIADAKLFCEEMAKRMMDLIFDIQGVRA